MSQQSFVTLISSWKVRNILPLADNACPLEKAASSSGHIIAEVRTVDAFASWVAGEATKTLHDTIGVVQDVYLLRDMTVYAPFISHIPYA